MSMMEFFMYSVTDTVTDRVIIRDLRSNLFSLKGGRGKEGTTTRDL